MVGLIRCQALNEVGGSNDRSAYEKVAAETGGASGSLCGEQTGEVIERLLREARYETSPYKMGHMPITSSLKLFLNDVWVPRSKEDGYTYSVTENAIEFHGSYVPKFGERLGPREAPDRMAMVYEILQVPRLN